MKSWLTYSCGIVAAVTCLAAPSVLHIADIRQRESSFIGQRVQVEGHVVFTIDQDWLFEVVEPEIDDSAPTLPLDLSKLSAKSKDRMTFQLELRKEIGMRRVIVTGVLKKRQSAMPGVLAVEKIELNSFRSEVRQ